MPVVTSDVEDFFCYRYHTMEYVLTESSIFRHGSCGTSWRTGTRKETLNDSDNGIVSSETRDTDRNKHGYCVIDRETY